MNEERIWEVTPKNHYFQAEMDFWRSEIQYRSAQSELDANAATSANGLVTRLQQEVDLLYLDGYFDPRQEEVVDRLLGELAHQICRAIVT